MDMIFGIMTVVLGQSQAEPAGGVGKAVADIWSNTYQGNELWRYFVLLGVILGTLVVGRIVRFILDEIYKRCEVREGVHFFELLMKTISRPAAMMIFGVGIYFSRLAMVFGDAGFSVGIEDSWKKIGLVIMSAAVAWWVFRLVDIVEYYLRNLTSRTETPLDDMLVPLIRKSLRIFVVIVSVLFIADSVLEMDVKTILAAAGIGGLAFALAAQDTVSNLFGSVTIFADRPFQVGDRIKIGGYDGPVEEVGFRSTRIRTLDGHLVSVPNSKIANDMVENISKRPTIKRVANITITYDTEPAKVEKALAIIKGILAEIPEINSVVDLPPRVYFNDFNEWSLNILVIYWVSPPDYWMYLDIAERVNLAMMRDFEAEGIEFAFPTQTLYVNKSDS